MALLLSSTDLAIAVAAKAGTLALVAREGRFGTYVSIEDDVGVIEVHRSASEADARVAAIQGALH